jgi:hypothetical protein
VLTLNASPVAGGTVTGGGTYANGSSVTVNATPAVGYVFSSWKEGTTVKSTSANYTFTLTNHTTLTATFVAQNRTITASAAPLAGGSVSGAGVVGNGATVTLTAAANAGYVFDHWTLGAANAGTANPITFDAFSDYAFVAHFVPAQTYAIAASAAPALGGSVSGGGNFVSGASVTLSAVANAGYVFTNWTEGSTVVSTLADYAFTAAENRTLVAHFAPAYVVDVTVPQGIGGFIEGIGAYAVGSAVTVTATADPGYRFTGWSVNGTPVSAAAAYTFTPADDLLLEANFALIIPQVNTAASTASALVLEWPADLPGWVLEESADLSPGSWVPSAHTVGLVGANSRVSIPAHAGTAFFRLVHP